MSLGELGGRRCPRRRRLRRTPPAGNRERGRHGGFLRFGLRCRGRAGRLARLVVGRRGGGPGRITPPAFTRAKECVPAVNAALALAGGLAVLALAEVAAFETVRARRLHVRVPQLRPAEQRMRRLGWIVTAAGAVLTVAGAIGLVLLVANARSTLFLYVGRPVVVLVGLLFLQPAIGMGPVGLALVVGAARSVGGGRSETT